MTALLEVADIDPDGLGDEDDLPETCLAWPPDPPRPGEGLLGWMLREASEQHVPNIGIVLRRATPRRNLLAPQRIGARLDAEALAAAMLVGTEVVEPLLYPWLDDGRVDFHGVAMPSWHLTSRRRFSPAALRRDGAMRTEWERKFLPSCPGTGEFLTDRCLRPDCGSVQRWHWAVGIDACPSCGGDLAARSRRTVPDAWRPRLDAFAAMTSWDAEVRDRALDSLPPSLRGFDGGDALELVHGLFPFCGEPPLTVGTSRWWRRRPFRLAGTLARATEVAMGWPDAAVARLASPVGRCAGGGGMPDRIMRFDGVRRGGRAHAALIGLREGLRTDGRGRETGTADALSILAAARLLGTGTAEIADARRAGRLAVSPMVRGGELVMGLDGADIAAAASVLRQRISPWTASLMIGVPLYAVGELVASGLLALVAHPYVAALHGSALDPASVTSLLDALERTAIGELDDPVPLRTVMLGVGGRPKPWAEALSGILDLRFPGALAAGPEPPVGRLLVPSGSIDALRKLGRDADRPLRSGAAEVARGDALEILNRHGRYSTALTARFGGTEDIGLGPLMKLAAERIAPAEAAARWGIGYQSAAAAARRQDPPIALDDFGWDRKRFEELMEGGDGGLERRRRSLG